MISSTSSRNFEGISTTSREYCQLQYIRYPFPGNTVRALCCCRNLLLMCRCFDRGSLCDFLYTLSEASRGFLPPVMIIWVIPYCQVISLSNCHQRKGFDNTVFFLVWSVNLIYRDSCVNTNLITIICFKRQVLNSTCV